MNLDNISNQVFVVALNEAKLKAHEYITPEHYLYAALMFSQGKDIIENGGGNIEAIRNDLNDFFEKHIPRNNLEAPMESFELIHLFEMAMNHVISCGKQSISLGDIIAAMFNLNESFVRYILDKNGANRLDVLKYISHSAEPTESSQEQSGQETDTLKRYTQNLTEKAKNGLLDPLVGRDEILNRTIQVLCRRLKNNPIHVGDPGVGKTAVVEGLAQRIADNSVPEVLKGSTVYYIDMGAVVAGTKYRGDFEERLIKILDSLSKTRSPIVYLDEIHTIVGAGATSSGGMDATSILKPYFSKGDIRFIGSTTYEEYKKYFEKDRALSRRFQKIDVPEPNIEESIKILTGLKDRYERYHNVVYTDEIISHICELSVKYIRDRYLPDKAIDIMDETGAFIRMTDSRRIKYVITKKDVERCVSQTAHVPEDSLKGNETDKLRQLVDDLKKQIFGQDKALEMVADAIKASRLGLTNMEKPVASLLFVGPTGVGKTEIARQLAAIMGITLMRYDMSEYQEKHSVARLIGAPPGYVGYDEGGLLTEGIRKTPHCVLLLDEIEKAHQDIINVLLQIMDYGVLTDNIGRKADFRNVIIIMTSNAGAREMGRHIIGFDGRTADTDAIDAEVERIFSPEFRNRLDTVIVFNHMNPQMARLIVKKAISNLNELLSKKNVSLTVSEKAADYIANKGLSEKYGAREIIRIIDKELKKKLADAMLTGKLPEGGCAEVNLSNGELELVINGNEELK